ncbi:MAG: Prolyl tripeptidyl peptidase precursor [Chloroflexi bacterium ADurb.Bin222]|nr:MAG: Prolyl tripeptidyl peptidase precursor [Chloroflexi bacterium ADurb.Bin222]
MTSEPIEAPEISKPQPTLRDMVMLDIPFAAKAAPEGNQVALLTRTTNWNDNQYERLCYIHDLTTGVTSPLTRTGYVFQMEWLDKDTLILRWTGPDYDDKPQIWLYERLLGQAWQVTHHRTGVDWFAPFAGGVLFLASHPEREKRKPRTSRFGRYTHFEHDDSTSALYYIGFEELRQYQAQLRAATEDEADKLTLPIIELSRLLPQPLSIRRAIPSPAGDAIYLNCWPRDDLVYYHETSSYAIRLDAPAALAEYLRREQEKQAAKASAAKATEEDEGENGADEEENKDEGKGEDEDENKETQADVSYLGELIQLPLPRDATITEVSPDGRQLLLSYQARDNKMYTQTDLWTVDAATALQAPDAETLLAAMANISAALDEEVMDVTWTSSGIIGSYVDSTRIRLARFGVDGQVTSLDLGDLYAAWVEFNVSKSGRLAFIGANSHAYPDAYIVDLTPEGLPGQPRKISDFGRAVADWDLGTAETIRWTSKDGVEIEGVLRKPSNFDPQKQYPLLFIVHGGPSWFSPEYWFCDDNWGYYPAAQFLHKEFLIVEPNYRGSIGRGQAFMELNVDNLGVGDLWDVESAIDHLDRLGWIDTERVGCMGWSQGGYISAFAGLHSKRFKAVSVGAGISDWYTYHISNDIPSFTLDYLSSSPFRDRELYLKTSPISNLADASTPMLIQHGSEDRRVPLSNALELYRGLQEMGVPVELFIFPGMGHPITRPRENHAILHQNLTWFSHYLLGEELQLE